MDGALLVAAFPVAFLVVDLRAVAFLAGPP